MYLLDTNVVSEFRKTKPHGAVLAWFQTLDEDEVAIPAIVIGEIQAGVEITRRQDPEKANEIEAWLDKVLDTFTVVPMDGVLFREWSRLMNDKSDELTADAMIAATGRVHNYVIATRNLSDFAAFNVSLFNPFTFTEGYGS